MFAKYKYMQKNLLTETQEKYLQRIAELLEQQLALIKLINFQKIQEIINDNLETDTDKLIYELSDGTRSVREIEKLTNVSRTTISNLWEKWTELGLMKEDERVKGRKKRLISLNALGINVPRSIDKR